MSALPLQALDFDPLRDSRHRTARAARDQADWLSWLELGGTRPRTLSDYEWATARLLRMFPSKELADITDGDLAHVLRTFPAQSRRTKQAAFVSWFKWAAKTKRTPANPMEDVPNARKADQKPLSVFTEAEVAMLTSLPTPDGTLMRILFETGIRKGEARRLQARHVQLDRAQLQVIDGKGGKDRTIPLLPGLCQVLAEYMIVEGLEREDFFWYGRRANQFGNKLLHDRPVGEGTFARWWMRCVSESGVKDYRTPHAARHTFATMWRRRGLGLEEIQVLLGHASLRTTQIYLHVDLELVAERMAALSV